MARSYRSKHPHWTSFAASLERDVLRSLGITYTDSFNEAKSRHWRTLAYRIIDENYKPLSRTALAAELRRRGWPAKRALAAAYSRNQYEFPDKDDRRFYNRALRRRVKQRLQSHPECELFPRWRRVNCGCCMCIRDWLPPDARDPRRKIAEDEAD